MGRQEFYIIYKTTYDKHQSNGPTIIIGDFNARIQLMVMAQAIRAL